MSEQSIVNLETENAQLRNELLKFKMKNKETAPKVDYELLSDRCRAVVNFLADNEWSTRAMIGDRIDLTHQQITCTMELLRKRGIQFDSREIAGKRCYEYRISENAARPSKQLVTRSLKASNERLIIEMNRIRNTASDGVHREIERMATQALNACGLQVGD
jgi:hypothetical protein